MTKDEALQKIETLLNDDESVSDIEIRRTKRGFIVIVVDRRVMTGER